MIYLGLGCIERVKGMIGCVEKLWGVRGYVEKV